METGQEQPGAMQAAVPQEEHRWLQKLVGEWTYEAQSPSGNGQSPTKMTGTESVRPIGGIWVQAEGRGEMPDGEPAQSLMTLGYDPMKGRYVGTWVGSMMTHLWLYDGQLNPEETTLTLDCEGPSMSGGGKMSSYRDVIEFRSEGHRLLRALVEEDDGSWREFMVAHYRRRDR